MRKHLALLAAMTAFAVPAVLAPPAAASQGVCNASQCYWSIHVGSADGSPWLAQWESDWLNTSAYNDLVNSYSSLFAGFWHGGLVEPIQWCGTSCDSNNPAYKVYIGGTSWLQGLDITPPAKCSTTNGQPCKIPQTNNYLINCGSSYCYQLGYHTDGTVGNTGWNGAYAVIDTTQTSDLCSALGSGTEDNLDMKVFSHEVDEAMVDPYPQSSPVYASQTHNNAIEEIVDNVAGHFWKNASDSSIFVDFTRPRYWEWVGATGNYDELDLVTANYDNTTYDQYGTSEFAQKATCGN